MKILNRTQALFFVFAAIFSFVVLSPDFVNAVPPKANLVPSDYDTGITWKKAIKDKKPIAVNFYVDWCHYCKRFAPTLESVRQQYQDKFDFVLVKADDPKNRKLVEEFNVEGYPSFYLVNPKTNLRQKVDASYYANPGELSKQLDFFLKGAR